MFRRTLHTLITLAAIIVAYQAYVLLAVPWLEPPLALREARHVSDDERNIAEQSVTRYQRLLAHYFPPGHWALVQPPKVIESGPVMFVLDDYNRQEDGRVDLTRCALVIFPTPRVDGAEPPRDAVILEAPQGAKLQFDENFQPARGQLGQITRGEFPGPITIRSDMRAPGPEDDLLVETSDLEMNTKLLYTTHDVRFRLGPNVGSGREMEIRFLEEEGSSSKTGGLKIAGVDSLELRRNVRLRVFLETDSLLPGNDRERPDPQPASAATAKPPVEVTCTGPFHFDFIRYVAGFDQNVELWQVNPEGPSDHLSCQQLDIHFSPKPPAFDATKPAALDPPQRQQKDLGRLEPDRVVAQGHPVIVVSPSRGAEARGARVQLALRERKVTIDGGSDAVLVYGQNYLRAPLVEYQHPAPDSTTKIGRFRAEGTGSLHYLPDATKPEQVLEATWQGGVKLGRYNGQPMLTLTGRPQLAVTGVGRLAADEMQVYLRELETDGTRQPAVALPGQTGLGSKLQVVPDRMSAVGHVQIESPQLVGRMQELRGEFRIEPEQAGADDSSPDDKKGGFASQFAPTQPGQEASKTYHLDTDKLNLKIALRGQHAVPTGATCERNVVFRELPSAAGDEGLLEIRGGQLTLDHLDTSAHVTIVGAAPGEPAGSRPAQIQARGMTMLTAAVELDAGENRLWSDGPGKATMLVTRDLQGNATSTPFPMELQWEGGLNFDGRFVSFQRRVLVQGSEDWLRCDQLAAKLTAPIVFGQSNASGLTLDLAEIQCAGHVAMDHRARDEKGPTSHERVDLGQLSINQQTGVITGQGPGTIRSTHYSDQANSMLSPAIAGAKPAADKQASAAPSSGSGAKLHFFRVDFQGGLAGNMYVREMKLEERVRVVYGPVDSWEQELDLNRPETLSPGAVTLICDLLRVNEDPVAASLRRAKDPSKGSGRAMGPMQLWAEGNVRIDGESPSQGVFAAQANRATYEQAKETFILDGTPNVPATLWHRPHAGGPMAQNAARKITYHRLSGQFKVEDIRSFEYTPPTAPASAPQNARGPEAVPVR